MTRFERVQQILDSAVGPGAFGGHGPFWRTQTRDAFVAHVVFGRKLLNPGNGSTSNLVKALRGEAPFGSDIGAPGGVFRRMPAGRAPVLPADIDFIATWIDDGCPEDELSETAPLNIIAGAAADAAAGHNAFWRDFDTWAMFEATPQVRAAINAFFAVAPRWMDAALDAQSLPAWQAALADADVADAVTLLSGLQGDTVRRHYGDPAALMTLLDSFEQFGAGLLPDNPERPGDPHRMNGPEMWFFWAAFADACLRLRVAVDFWAVYTRAMLLGLLNDGLFRRRFRVTGFDAAAPGTHESLRRFVSDLSAEHLQEELAERFRESGFGQ